MTEIELLIAKAYRSLEAAECMREGGFDDVSVSRAYYAMFYMAWAALLTKGVSVASHDELIAGFEGHFVRDGTFQTLRQQQLSQAYEQRIRSDYRILEETTSSEALQVLCNAEEFLGAVKQYLDGESGT